MLRMAPELQHWCMRLLNTEHNLSILKKIPHVAPCRADFAGTLLPHVMADLALHVVDLDVCHQISKQANSFYSCILKASTHM